jgi:hypothetical protein
MLGRNMSRVSLSLAVTLLAIGCSQQVVDPETGDPASLVWRELDPPSAPGSFAPGLSVGDDEALLTWWERMEDVEGERSHRLMFSRFEGSWSEPSVVAADQDFFANWADFPAPIREPRGSLLVFWLAKTASPTFSYSIFLARSHDDGLTWEPLGKLNDDDTDTEHGFTSMVVEGDAVRAYWLDGRLMADEGPMTVRTARIGETVGPSELLDDRVCECCPTDAVATSDGSMVAFRDRSEDETREIAAVSRRDGSFTASAPVTRDGWRIPGCPVNGPAVDFEGGRTALAWFTAADSTPRVSVAFRPDLDGDFGVPALVDDSKPLGRVGLALDDSGDAIVSWLAIVEKEAELRLRRITPVGSMGEPFVVGRTSAARASGMPQLERLGEDLLVAWVEILGEAPSRIRVRAIPSGMIPSVAG